MGAHKAVGSETTQRYTSVALSMEWVRMMQHMDEFKGFSHSELAKRAADDILSKRITEDDVAKLRKTAPAAEPVEKKVEEPVIEEEEASVKKKKK